MADFRGSMGLAIANIRAYILSGDNKFKLKFQENWITNTLAFEELNKKKDLLTSEQYKSFKILSASRAIFSPLPQEMFDLRSGDKWNLANYQLATDAAPLAFEIKELLNDMRHNQKDLRDADFQEVFEQISSLKLEGWVLLLIGIVASGALGFLITRSTVKPVKEALDVANAVAEGNLDIDVNIGGSVETKNLGLALEQMIGQIKQRLEEVRIVEELTRQTIKDRSRGIIDSSIDTIITIDEQDIIQFINLSGENMFGYQAEELIGQNIKALIPEDNSNNYKVFGQEKLVGGAREVEARCKDDSMLPIRLAISEVVTEGYGDEHDEKIYVGIMADLTTEVAAREELKQKTDIAETASKTKSSFLANMSHEIRTPLNGIIGMTELLGHTGLDEKQLKYTKMIGGSGDVLATLIDDILDFSKLEAGEIMVHPEPVDLYGAMKELMEILSPRALENNVEFIIKYDERIPTIVADIVRIKQIILNLAGNALKFSADRYVQISTNIKKETSKDITILFEIEDGGIGIEQEMQNSIFERFVQADSTTTKKYGGTGLGLSISKSLVELMEGDIGLQSVPGEGSTFWFELTLSKHAENLSERSYDAPLKITTKRILVVDDSEEHCKLITEYLTQWGIGNDYVVSGKEALRELEFARQNGKPYDIVLADYMMPGMDGEQLMTSIRSDEKFNDLKCILLTGFHKIDGTEKAQEMGYLSCIAKPVYPSELLDALMLTLSPEERAGGGGAEPVSPSAVKQEGRQTFDMHVLLAEDTLVNQMVAEEMLLQMGCRVEIAGNGKIALQKYQSNNYDLILMDCRMPEMDGYKATGEIRKLEQAGRNHTPIIAMTANAMDGDKEKCLEAGMDDYLSKPTKEKDIHEMFCKFFPDNSSKYDTVTEFKRTS